MFIKFDRSATCFSGKDQAVKKNPGENEEAAKADFARMISEKKSGMARAAVNGGNRESAPSTKDCGKEMSNNCASAPKKSPRQEVAKDPGADSNGVKKQTGAPTGREQVREGGKKEPAATPRPLGGREDKNKNTFTSQTVGEEGGQHQTFSSVKSRATGGSFTSAALGEEGGQDHTFTTKTGGEEGGGKEDTFKARATVKDIGNGQDGVDALTSGVFSQLLGEKGGDDEEDEEDDFPVEPMKMTTMSLGEEGGKMNGLA
jgi:hypothetical protein